MANCKYCGAEIKQSGALGWCASGTGWTCKNSPDSKHVLGSGVMVCKYCGKEVKPQGPKGLCALGTGWTCANSPNKKHCLP